MNVRGGQLQQSPLNPVWPGTRLTGPLLAGNILRSGGPGLAGLGTQDQNALGNVGYAEMVQVGRITQVAAPGFASPDLVIPAQSLIFSITVLPVTPFSGAASTLGIGTPSNPTFFTAAGAINAAASVKTGIEAETGATLLNWLNVGNQDVQLVFASTNAGAGVAIAIVEYIQGINAPTT